MHCQSHLCAFLSLSEMGLTLQPSQRQDNPETTSRNSYELHSFGCRSKNQASGYYELRKVPNADKEVARAALNEDKFTQALEKF